jgi:hypothetical protein
LEPGSAPAEPKPYELTIDEVLTILRSAPADLSVAAKGVAPARLQAASEPGEWSAAEILAHIRSCCDVWGGCIGRIVDEDVPAFRAVSPRTYIRKTNYAELIYADSLRAYAEQRAGLLAVLDALGAAGWARIAMVKQMTGQITPRSVFYFANRLAGHEDEHVRQIERTISQLNRTTHSEVSSADHRPPPGRGPTRPVRRS